MKKLLAFCESHYGWLMALLLTLWFALFLMGCTSPRQDQYLANARAGAQALKDPSVSPDQRALIAQGAALYTLLATDDMALPAPEMAPPAIVANPPAYEHAAATAPPAQGFNAWLIGGVIAVASAAFPFLRNLPFLKEGATYAANLAFALIAPKVARVRDQLAHAAYDETVKSDSPSEGQKG